MSLGSLGGGNYFIECNIDSKGNKYLVIHTGSRNFGLQVGKVYSYSSKNTTIWSSVGIQKWNNVYKVYIDEIEEKKMEAEEYLRKRLNVLMKYIMHLNK